MPQSCDFLTEDEWIHQSDRADWYLEEDAEDDAVAAALSELPETADG